MELVLGLYFLLFCACLLFVNLSAKLKTSPFIKSLRDKHVFVTGGSSGIGLAIAKKAIQEQAFVTLVSRSASNLAHAVDQLVNSTRCSRDRILCQVADVGDYSAIAAVVKEATLWRPIDVLVCNAGVTRGGYLDNARIEDLDLTIRTNLNGTVYALHAALPSLKERSVEHPISIVIVSSMVSLFFLYGHCVYTATKHALRGLADCLRAELIPYNIRVSLLCPGFVNTPFLDDVVSERNITEVLSRVNLLNREKSESPESVAEATIDIVKRGSCMVVTQTIGTALLTLGRGMMPADNVLRGAFELVMLVPFRIFSIKFAGDVRRHVLDVVNKSLKS